MIVAMSAAADCKLAISDVTGLICTIAAWSRPPPLVGSANVMLTVPSALVARCTAAAPVGTAGAIVTGAVFPYSTKMRERGSSRGKFRTHAVTRVGLRSSARVDTREGSRKVITGTAYEKVLVQVVDDISPIYLRSEGTETSWVVVMPMRVK